MNEEDKSDGMAPFTEQRDPKMPPYHLRPAKPQEVEAHRRLLRQQQALMGAAALLRPPANDE